MQTSLILPAEAKIWVYQSNRDLTPTEIEIVNHKMNTFLSTWQSHGSDLTGKYEIVYNRFLILSADESSQQATGCSIDKSVSLIKELENELSINLTDKSKVAYLTSNDEINLIDFREIKPSIEAGKLNSDTTIFNSSISTFKDYQDNWKIPAKDSWLSRYF